jgi:two-component system sensor histidine kinase MprB
VHEHVEMVDVVERALQRVSRRAGDVRFESRLQPCAVVGDATALERAVLNLLDNAAKWSPPTGVVRVALSLDQRPDEHPDKRPDERTDQRLDERGWVVLEVMDEGPGIAEHDLPRVFDRFYRATEDRGRPGSGLGLAIVKQVAERHGGSVRAGRGDPSGALLALRIPASPL